ncbi:Karyopherin transporter [Mucor velutinosus]|uniref:Karyopherin transporter n=1 Tax=Mucor velutinosus TaxID=708070 RepID=A0AAN7D5H8_9FUNG|nr:Karyopherin transporter [Mucor velutinosus]
MTSSVTRSSRSSIKKAATASNDNMLQKTKSSAIKKKKQKPGKKDVDHDMRSKKQQKEEQHHDNGLDDEIQQADKDNESLSLGKIDATQHPEYTSLMKELDQSKLERLQKIENWQRLERQSIHDWFAAQKKQAWNDFYFARKKVRSDLVQNVQNKITRLEQELGQLNVQCGATNEEADRDLTLARQPYNGSNTPNLVYSDYESRSTTDSAEDGEASSPRNDDVATSPSAVSEHQYPSYSHHRPSFVQYQQQQQQQQQQRPQQQQPYYHQSQSQHNHQPAASLTTYANSNSNTNMIYPPYEFEELPQDGRRDWWPYRSTTSTTTTA